MKAEERVSVEEFARAWGVERRAVATWLSEGLPHRKIGRRVWITPSEANRWRLERAQRAARDETAPDEAAERARKLRADADLAETKLAKMRGELVEAAAVRGAMERLCGMVRTRVLAARGRWAPQMIGLETMREATAALDALAEDVLRALVEGADSLEQEDEAPEEEAA